MGKNQENTKKKNMSIKIVTSGGGLAGIILLGGALVTAALVSTFAYKRIQKSKKGDDDNCLNKCSKGCLSFLVRDCLSPQLTRDHRPRSETRICVLNFRALV